ncbi:MAG TPA: Flp family type IVb pilin [Roseiflexaceae bacterium]|nr:Flp family type IVb pilin [Roseiflexaceae bacterium]
MNTRDPLPDRHGDQQAGIRKRIWHTTRRRLAASGQGLVEYALILALIAIVVIGVLTELGGQTSQIFSSVGCTLDGGAVASSSSSHPGSPQGGGGGVGNNTNTTTTGGC